MSQKEDKLVEEDYTTKAELEALLQLKPLEKDHKAVITCLLGVSSIEFWNSYLENNAPSCLTKFYHDRGE